MIAEWHVRDAGAAVEAAAVDTVQPDAVGQ
jgi:hypothetical protein